MTIGSQLQRAALSVPTNLVEGSSRASARERFRFIEIADGSLREAGYLIEFAERMGLWPPGVGAELRVLHAQATEALGRRRNTARRAVPPRHRRPRRARPLVAIG